MSAQFPATPYVRVLVGDFPECSCCRGVPTVAEVGESAGQQQAVQVAETSPDSSGSTGPPCANRQRRQSPDYVWYASLKNGRRGMQGTRTNNFSTTITPPIHGGITRLERGTSCFHGTLSNDLSPAFGAHIPEGHSRAFANYPIPARRGARVSNYEQLLSILICPKSYI